MSEHGYDYKNFIKEPESDLEIIFMELQNNLLGALDTFTLVKQYGIWWENLKKDEPTDHLVDKIIAIKLKEYLLIQLSAIFYDKSSESVASVHNLKEHLPERAKYLVEEFNNRQKGILERISCLRNKLFAHNEIIKKDSTKIKINNYRNNVSNEDIDKLFKDALDMLTKLAYEDLNLPVPITDSLIENDVISYFKEK